MKANRIGLAYDWDQDLNDGGISVPGVIGEINLIEECWCVNNRYDQELGLQAITAKKDCDDCNGTGISITRNGRIILKLIEVSTERK